MQFELNISSDVVKVFIEKLSAGIGAIYEPIHIKKLAEAKAQKRKVEAQTDIEIVEMQNRAIERLLKNETRNQHNIESIVRAACDDLPPSADPLGMDDDWIANIFEKCKTVSNKQMQSIWAKLLSAEATSPGQISKKTIDVVSTLDSRDAYLFTQLCTFNLCHPKKGVFPLILSANDPIYMDHGINYETLNHLVSLGLIIVDYVSGFDLHTENTNMCFEYFQTKTQFVFENPKNINKFGRNQVLLSRAGIELAPFSGATPSPAFLPYIFKKLAERGIKGKIVI